MIPIKSILGGIAALFITITMFLAAYTIEEGHVGIVKNFGEAREQVNPGLHFKVPFVETVEEIEVRTRQNKELMPSSTAEQMPVNVAVAVNWTVDRKSALSMYKEYGGLAQFESRILDPRLRSAVKAVIPRFQAEQLIQDRSAAIMQIEGLLLEEMAGYPIKVGDLQIENITLPKKYLVSIETKQTEKNLAAAEKHRLARQGLEAQRGVNTDKARAEGIAAIAEAEADAIKLKGLAEAAAIEAKAKALRDNPLIIKLTEAQNWDGKLPATIMGEGSMPIMDIRGR